MEFENVIQFEKVIEEIKPVTEELKVYGVYRKGETY
jgi:prephenate dehydratase